MRIFSDASYPFLQWRKKGFIVSAVVLVFGIAAMGWNTVQTGSWLNYGVDFAGGTLVQVEFVEPTTENALRSAVAAQGVTGWDITRFGSDREFVVRMPTDPDAEVTGADQVQAIFGEEFGAEAISIQRVEAVGPRVGAELQQRALFAILASFLLTLVYIAIRFEWRFGVASVAATAHDILVTLGFLALVNMEISVATVAAFLTIVGYSLNDTIVIFDRVRENVNKLRKKPEWIPVLNQSINETLPRTALTSGTTLVVLMSLFILGGAVIRDFALVLALGVVIGTYSSIFVAAPALRAIEERWPHETKRKRSTTATRGGRPKAGATL